MPDTPDTNAPGQVIPDPAPQPNPDMSAPPIDDPNREEPGSPQGSDAAPNQMPTTVDLTPTDLYAASNFAADIARYQSYANRKTGFAAMDAIQPLYPGLYALGGVSSLGKTTLAHHLADNLAAAGEHVLYFSLEQSMFELFSKSISRRLFLANRQDMAANNQPSAIPTYASIQIRSGIGQGTQEMATQIQAYISDVADRMNVAEGNFSITVGTIINTVDKYIADKGVKPIVIIDYLQIIAPSHIGNRFLDNRANIDHAVHELKTFQTRHDLTIIVLSSLNRQNYLTPVDFESFKESGGIEYTADVLWGLQLSCMNDDLFGKEGKAKEKRDMIREEKMNNPRLVQLVYLKNRYGSTGNTANFEYYPASDTFLSNPVASTGPSPDL